MTLAVLVALLGLGAATLLLSPVRVRVDVDTGAPESSQRLRWRVRWLMVAFGSGPRRARKKREARPRPDRRPRPHPARRALAALSTPGLSRRFRRLVARLAAPLRPRAVEGVIRVGLDDPASTGMLFGQLQAVGALIPATWRVRVDPDFTHPAFEARGHAEWSVAPARILGPVAAFLVSPVVWRAAWAARRGR